MKNSLLVILAVTAGWIAYSRYEYATTVAPAGELWGAVYERLSEKDRSEFQKYRYSTSHAFSCNGREYEVRLDTIYLNDPWLVLKVHGEVYDDQWTDGFAENTSKFVTSWWAGRVDSAFVSKKKQSQYRLHAREAIKCLLNQPDVKTPG